MTNVTSADFQTAVLNSPIPVLVDFWAEWCGPCKMMKPEIEKVAGQYTGRANVLLVDADANADLASAYGVQGMPTLLLFKNGQIVNRASGFQNARQLATLIESGL